MTLVLLVLSFVGLAWIGDAGTFAETSFWGALFPGGGSLRLTWDSTGRGFALLVVGCLALSHLADWKKPQGRAEAALFLLVVAASVGVCLAGSLPALLLAWAILDVSLIFGGILQAPEEQIPHVVRHALVSVISTVLLVVAAVLASGHGETTQAWWVSVLGPSLPFVVLAALLRLGPYPLPGSRQRAWDSYLLSALTGGYVWLRIAPGAVQLLSQAGWPVTLAWGSLIMTGLLAGLGSVREAVLSAILLNQMALLVLAPLLDVPSGSRVVTMTVANLGLCLPLLRIYQVSTPEHRPWWLGLPRLVAFASLLGAPLTLGGQVYWLLSERCWQGGQVSWLLLTLIAHLLVSVPFWTLLRREADARPAALSESRFGVAQRVFAYGLAIVLLFLAFDLGVLRTDVLGVFRDYPTLPWTRIAQPLQYYGILVLVAYIIPLFGGWGVSVLKARLLGRGASCLDMASAFLELDWLYSGAEAVLGVVGRVAEFCLSSIEESFYLGWIVLWILVFLLLLFGS